MTVISIFFDGTGANHICASQGLIYSLFINEHRCPFSFYFPGPGGRSSGKYFTKKIDQHGHVNLEETTFNHGYFFDTLRGFSFGKGWDENTDQACNLILLGEKYFDVRAVFLYGWSRGALCCNMLANKLYEHNPNIDVYIYAFDPVPGPMQWIWSFKPRAFVNKNVKKYISFLAEFEVSQLFHGLITLPFPENTSTVFKHYLVPANHLTVVGLRNKHVSDLFSRTDDDRKLLFLLNAGLERDTLTPDVGKLVKFISLKESQQMLKKYMIEDSHGVTQKEPYFKLCKFEDHVKNTKSYRFCDTTKSIIKQPIVVPDLVNKFLKLVTTNTGSYRPFWTFHEWRSSDIKTLADRYDLHDKIVSIENVCNEL